MELEIACSLSGGGARRENGRCNGELSTPYGRLCLLCAGLSGPPENLLAGRIAFEIIRRIFGAARERDPEKLMKTALCEVNDVLHEMVSSSIYSRGMGADLAVLLVDTSGVEGAVACLAGRAGIYRLRRGGRWRSFTGDKWRTVDGNAGSSGRDDDGASAWRRCGTPPLGVGRSIEPLPGRADVKPGDRYLLCSSEVARRLNARLLDDCLRSDPCEHAELLAERAAAIGNGIEEDHIVQVVDVRKPNASN